ncbi:carbohydrate-binding protein [Planotetraspora sp. GP83]|uniref:carbohydrate-binding protein n=1 Tax=Planotetraspora sp. GP83 TaxID=3156264 RepID=UPI00351199AE
MSRRALGATLTAACLILLSVFAALLSGTPAYAATTRQTFLTFYGWYDNTPPGGDISYPQIHSTAGGKGTYSDPITFATSTAEAPAGTKIYVPRVKKYFIMEDGCQECGEDWSGNGPNGGPGLYHFDLWLGGKGGNAMDAIDCEDALTHYNSNGTPTMEPVIVNPGSSEVVDSTPIFNTSTGECYGGAQPNKWVGEWKNASTGTCIDDPNNSSSTGTALKLAACSGAANQRFTFHGAFLVINNLCAGMSGGNIVLQTCTAGPAQQWSINPDGTITDIQTGQKCIRASGTSVVAGSCSGTSAQWIFPPEVGSNDFSVSVSPTSGTVDAGSSATATVSTAVTAGSAQSVTLSASGLPSGASASFSPASVNAGASSTVTITTSSSTPGGTYPVTIKGTGGSGTHTATYSLTVNGQPGSATDYQAEDGVLSAAGVFSNHLGYTGTGFVDYVNAAGGYIQFSVNATAAGAATVTIRYANGATDTRPLDVSVNGAVAASGVAFPPTTNWDTWVTKSVTVNLAAGANTIRLTGPGATGGPNVDKITVEQRIIDTAPPSVPGNLHVTGTTSSSVSLAWDASTDDTGVTGYQVYNGASPATTVSGTTATVTGLTPSTSYTFTVKAKDAAGNLSGASGPATATTGAVATPKDYQAEDGVLSAAGVFTNHLGYTGTGFVDYVNAPGGYIELTVNADSAGATPLTIRYSNGTTTARPLDVSVNGTVAASGVSFGATTNWDTWVTKSVTVNLVAGTNTIRLTGNGSTGGPNVDKITIG